MEENENLETPVEEGYVGTEDLGQQNPEQPEISEGILEAGPTEEQLAFQAKIEALGFEKNDVVLFRNGEIGRIDASDFIFYDMIYRIYVKIGDVMVTLNEELIDMSGNKKHDAQKILSSDFTKVKKEVVFTEIVLTKEEAEAKLSEAEGQVIIIE